MVLSAFAMAMYAEKDVTTFLGIPVDGTKSEMLRKLKAKGFYCENSEYPDVLTGEFNGHTVNLHVATNNNKVYRIMLADANTFNEASIRIRFNNLCYQFENNSKYIFFQDNNRIPEDEDISYEMAVNNKRYEAIFYQQPDMTDTVAIQEFFKDKLYSKYTEEQMKNPTEEETEQMANDVYEFTKEYLINVSFKKSVWFMISEFRGEYSIAMFYDNEYNKANGEDL